MTTRYTLRLVMLAIMGVGLWLSWICVSPFANHHPLPAGPSGSVSWRLLAQARDESFSKEMHYLPRYYPAAVKKIAGSEILIKGYMIAMHPNATFSHFLLVPFPPTCPYCVPVGPSQIIEAHTARPVAFSLTPVLVRGVLKLRDDDVSNLFYSMVNSEIIEE